VVTYGIAARATSIPLIGTGRAITARVGGVVGDDRREVLEIDTHRLDDRVCDLRELPQVLAHERDPRAAQPEECEHWLQQVEARERVDITAVSDREQRHA